MNVAPYPLAAPPQSDAADLRVRRIVASFGVCLCIGAVTVSAAGSPADSAFGRGLLELLIVGVPIATGLYALRAPVNRRLGIAMISVGCLWSLTALGQTSASVPYTIGRVATWFVFPGVVYLLLAFPAGRIAKGLDRVVFSGIVAVLLFLFLGTAPLVEAYPQKTLWATCTTDCPANALFILDHQPGFLPDLILVREWLVELLWLGIFWSMYRRFRAASPLQKRAMAPVFAAGTFLGLFHIAHITYRQLGGPTNVVIALSSAWTVSIVFVCAAFAVGLIRRRMQVAATLTSLSDALRVATPPAQMRDALAVAVGDPDLNVLFRDPDEPTWHDVNGRAVDAPSVTKPDQAVTIVSGGDDSTYELALIHDVALRDDPELLSGASGIVVTAWREWQLISDFARATSELEASRGRIAEAADLARVQIERDLHDGAQQRLFALRASLALAEEDLQRDPRAAAATIRQLGKEAELALEELRALSHGLFPSLLLERGLPDALRSVAQQCPTPAHVRADGVTRHEITTESAVYFTCVEALQNAAKHADRATGVWIDLEESAGELRFEVRDDGIGFAVRDLSTQGLRNMHDRIEAIGGRLTVESQPGAGTRVFGAVRL